MNARDLLIKKHYDYTNGTNVDLSAEFSEGFARQIIPQDNGTLKAKAAKDADWHSCAVLKGVPYFGEWIAIHEDTDVDCLVAA